MNDRILKGAALGGVFLALFPLFGLIVPVALLILWFLYLSFYLEGYPFLSFQWDALLLETGFIAIFYSILSPAPPLLHIALWILLFKLMFSSGLVKWCSGCPEWHRFLALDYHFETQPLPNVGGFFAHQWVKKGSRVIAILVFIFEVFVPLLFFGPDFLRFVGGFLTIFFQFLIMATGNYAFFNLLTIALCFPLLSNPAPFLFDPLSLLLNALGAAFIFYNLMILAKQFLPISFNVWGLSHLRAIAILNTYGLFAVMTTIRDEIIVEGSQDGEIWKEYIFKYKPGLSNRGIDQIAPLHPRLDWQMWFAALGGIQYELWFETFLWRLFQGSKPVLGLLKENPFPDAPPQYLRAQCYRFHFNTLAEWRKTGEFWNKTYVKTYFTYSE